MVETPTHIAAMTSDWWTGEAVLAFTPKTNADDANASGKISLASLAYPSQATCTGADGYTDWYGRAALSERDDGVGRGADLRLRLQCARAPAASSLRRSTPRIRPRRGMSGHTSIALSRPSYGFGYYDYYDGGCEVGLDGYAYYEYGGFYGSIIGIG